MVPLSQPAGLALLKVGGSISERGNPAPIMQAAAELAQSHPLIIVPGGADFAETVRQAATRFSLDDATAHRMALLAMDQYGLLLANLVGAAVTADFLEAIRIARSGRLPVLLPSQSVLESPLPASWQVTSDTVAAWLAGRLGATQLILLKDVDGVFEADPRSAADRPALRRMAAAPTLRGVVDEAFPEHLPFGLRCWILNGAVPARLTELLLTGSTLGTEVSV